MDFYVILGIEKGATLADVKRAYKRLARRYHPDINPGDRLAAAEFRRIAEAYETLSDPDRRHQYDVAGAGVQREPEVYGFEGFDFSVSVGGPSASTFGDLFAELLAPQVRAEAGESERGADLHLAVDLGFEAALRGGQHQVTVTRHDHCRTCRGTGTLGDAELECSLCHGSGVMKSARGHMVF